jgi:hypothetical protein
MMLAIQFENRSLPLGNGRTSSGVRRGHMGSEKPPNSMGEQLKRRKGQRVSKAMHVKTEPD